MSEASSGGVSSKTPFTAPIICIKTGLIASVTSSEVKTTVLGRPKTKSLPDISSFSGFERGIAEPILSLISSAV